jgi:hypothetical protein
MTIHGGNNSSGELSDAWVLTNANGLGGAPTWIQLGPFSPFAQARTAHSAVYDPSANTMVIFGGSFLGAGSAFNDVWLLSHANGK